MSKVEHIRPRYIAARIDPIAPDARTAVSRKAFAAALQAAARKAGWPEDALPRVSRYTWPHAAVRVPHDHAAAARALLTGLAAVLDGEPRQAVPVQVTTLATSGSLAGLARQTGVLTAPEPRTGAGPAKPQGDHAAAPAAPRSPPARSAGGGSGRRPPGHNMP